MTLHRPFQAGLWPFVRLRCRTVTSHFSPVFLYRFDGCERLSLTSLPVDKPRQSHFTPFKN